MYGSCNGLNKTGFCALDPTGENNKITQGGGTCSIGEGDENQVTLQDVDLSSFPTKVIGAEKTLVFIGCFNCDYTRKAYPTIKKLLSNNQVNFTFAHYPVKGETSYLLPIGYCAYRQNQEKYWQFMDKLFSSSKEQNENSEYVLNVLSDLGYTPADILVFTRLQGRKPP